MKSYLKFFALICVVTVSAAMLTACDNPPPPAAPEPVKQPNS